MLFPADTSDLMDAVSAEGEALLERLARARALVESERQAAPALCEELLALPAVRQGEAVAAEARFQTWGLCELLLDRSAAVLGTDAEEAARLAGLGLAAAAHLDPDVHSPALVFDLEARLWAALGEACRRTGELLRAEEALGQAAACVAHGSGDLLLDAQLLEFEAAVRSDQGRTSEADALLKQAAARYAALHEEEMHARAVERRTQIRRDLQAVQAAVPLGYGPNR